MGRVNQLRKNKINQALTFFLTVFFGLLMTVLSHGALVEKTTYKGSKWSPWSLSGFSLASIDLEQAHGPSGGSIFTYNYVGLNYRLSSNKKISFRPAFLYQTAGYDDRGNLLDQELKLHDVYFSLAHYDALLLPGNIGLSAQYRFYLPTSSGSKSRKAIGALGGWFTFNKPITPMSGLSYHVKPKYYLNTTTTYVHTFDDGGTQIRQNKQGNLEHYVEFVQRFSKDWAIQTSLKHYYQAYLESKAEDKDFFYREEAGFAVGLDYVATDKIRFIFNVEQKRNVKNPRDSFQLFRREETSYTLLTFLRLGYL